jgi:uncharacterized membrane protein
LETDFSRRTEPLEPQRANLSPRVRRAVIIVQRVSYWFARHWLALANSASLLALAGAAAIPVMMAYGLSWLADPLFASYHLICHQLPERSFFILGHQMAFCQRDTAIYGTMALAGLTVVAFRDRISPLPWLWFLLALVPIGVDGLTQLVGMRESIWQLRLITGAIFGAAVVWAAYPRIDQFAAEILEVERRRERKI